MSDEIMRRDWDARARANAFYYIDTRAEQGWDEKQFFASGEEDVVLHVDPALKAGGLDPAGASALEIGCGVGRMTRSLASRFGSVTAIDISEEMLKQARGLNPNAGNIEWKPANGVNLRQFDDSGFDFVFTFLVLQHIPKKDIVLDMISEIVRVCRPGGVFHFQYDGHTTRSMNRRGTALWWLIDHLRDPVLGINVWPLGKAIGKVMHLDLLAAGHTWRGAHLNPAEVEQAVMARGGTVSGTFGDGTARSWCSGTK